MVLRLRYPVFVVAVGVYIVSLGALAELPGFPEIQCVIVPAFVYSEYECVSHVSECGTTWPFGLDEIQLWHYTKYCQWWICDPVFGTSCTPIGDAWIEREWDRVREYFRGCGCDPGGDPNPFFVPGNE